MRESLGGTAAAFVRGARGLLACASQEQAPVHAPLAEIGSLKVVEPSSPPAAVVSSKQEGVGANSGALDHFERWAQDNVRFAFSCRPYRFDACFDRSDAEVACSNPTAVRQETRVWDVVASTVANRSGAQLTCEAEGSSKETAILPPKGTTSFSILTKPRAVGAHREIVSVRCSMPVGEAVKIGELPANTSERSVGVEVRYGGDAQITTRTTFIARGEVVWATRGEEHDVQDEDRDGVARDCLRLGGGQPRCVFQLRPSRFFCT